MEYEKSVDKFDTTTTPVYFLHLLSCKLPNLNLVDSSYLDESLLIRCTSTIFLLSSFLGWMFSSRFAFVKMTHGYRQLRGFALSQA